MQNRSFFWAFVVSPPPPPHFGRLLDVLLTMVALTSGAGSLLDKDWALEQPAACPLVGAACLLDRGYTPEPLTSWSRPISGLPRFDDSSQHSLTESPLLLPAPARIALQSTATQLYRKPNPERDSFTESRMHCSSLSIPASTKLLRPL